MNGGGAVKQNTAAAIATVHSSAQGLGGAPVKGLRRGIAQNGEG
jgi:hypothetical protein